MKKGESYRNTEFEADELDALLQLTINSLHQNKQGQVIYPETSDGLTKFKERSVEYFETVRTANNDPASPKRIVPDVESFCVFLGITRQTLLKYSKNRSEEWVQYIELVKDAIYAAKKQLATLGKMAPVLFIFDAANNNGYINTSQFNNPIDIEPERKALKAEDLPKLGSEKEN